uniref:Secreted protein n=1 Tax=Cucumis melo TaxID=3656 RepID=A0A9I9E1K5_CUCME
MVHCLIHPLFLCSVLVISLSIFGARTPRTSTITSGMLPDMFSRGIGQKASSLEGELWSRKRERECPRFSFLILW